MSELILTMAYVRNLIVRCSAKFYGADFDAMLKAHDATIRTAALKEAAALVHDMSMGYLEDGIDCRGFSIETQGAIHRAAKEGTK